MFYVEDAQGQLYALVEDNIFVDCGDCGKQHQVDYKEFTDYVGNGGELGAGEWMCEDCSQKFEEEMAQSKREDFGDTMAENDSALMQGFDLMKFIEGMNLPAPTHNELIALIDKYREECEHGACIKGAKERPYIEERTNGVLTAVYNEDNKSKREFTHEEMLERLGRFFEHGFTIADFREYYKSFCEGGDTEDPGIAADLEEEYPDLCAGEFNEKEWAEFVADTFRNLYDMGTLAPHFPRD